MLKTKSNRIEHCTHCNEEFIQTKSNQRFCSTSCRVASWKMNKEKKAPVKTKVVPPLPSSTPRFSNMDLAKVSAANIVSNLVVEGVKTFRGINNSDIVKKLDVILENQKTIANNQQVIVHLINSPHPKKQ